MTRIILWIRIFFLRRERRRRLHLWMIGGVTMRYGPEHKIEIHRKIVKDASRRIRAEGLNGAAVSAVMKDAGLTHGGFYKHFREQG